MLHPSSQSSPLPEKPVKDSQNALPVQYDNPWDFVPDQPSSNSKNNSGNSGHLPNYDSSSGISSSSNHSGNIAIPFANHAPALDDNWFLFDSKSSHLNGLETAWGDKSGILDDPFDAEWAALATRNLNNRVESPTNGGAPSSGRNPFRPEGQATIEKAFELQM
jgi:hypothetical protein